MNYCRKAIISELCRRGSTAAQLIISEDESLIPEVFYSGTKS